MYIITILVALVSTIIGAICGIGGGIIIKPILDALGFFSVATTSLYSDVTVLAMATFSVISNRKSEKYKNGIALTIGAIAGGFIGKPILRQIELVVGNSDVVTGVQSIILLISLIVLFIYYMKKENVKTYNYDGKFVAVSAGLFLGLFSTVLSVGGGIFNVALLSFLFSYDAKKCARLSLFIIMYSKISSLGLMIYYENVPSFNGEVLILIALAGIIGGYSGRKLRKRFDDKLVERLYLGVLAFIMGICVYNIFMYLG